MYLYNLCINHWQGCCVVTCLVADISDLVSLQKYCTVLNSTDHLLHILPLQSFKVNYLTQVHGVLIDRDQPRQACPEGPEMRNLES